MEPRKVDSTADAPFLENLTASAVSNCHAYQILNPVADPWLPVVFYRREAVKDQQGKAAKKRGGASKGRRQPDEKGKIS